MKRPIRWILRIALVLFVAGVAAVIAIFLLLDNFVREALIRRLHTATGMEVKIAAVHVGLRNASITIQGLKLYNTPEFGGSLCLDMPELHLEYDPLALRAGMLHLPFVRLNLADIGIVKDKKGKSNFDSLAKKGKPSLPSVNTNLAEGFKFSGIDKLDFSFGKLTVSDLRSGQQQEVNFNITNQVFHNVKSQADLEGVAVLLALRGSPTPGHSGLDLDGMLKDLISQ
ncbi:MAG TPA: hypothetical protein VH595_21375 [Verrucomicrobiae bacterium]|jgi:hypothetical protein|nr:hypothetical protein [Verrucomicrobiae bacterium]